MAVGSPLACRHPDPARLPQRGNIPILLEGCLTGPGASTIISQCPRYLPGSTPINCLKKRIQAKQKKNLSISIQHFSGNRLGRRGDRLTFPLREGKERKEGSKEAWGRRRRREEWGRNHGNNKATFCMCSALQLEHRTQCILYLLIHSYPLIIMPILEM